jgi:hypothetical protein
LLRKNTTTYLIPLVISSIVAIASFVLVLIYINPFHTGWFGHVFFYLTLLLSVSGVATTFSLLFRNRFWPGNYSDMFALSLRQGILIAFLVTALVFFETLNVLFWWVALTLILFLLAIEFFFSAPNK